MSQNTPPLLTPELPPDPLRPDQQGPPPPPFGPPPLPRMSDWLRRGRVAGAEQAAADLTNDEVMRRVTAGTQGPADAAELAQVAQELGLDPQHLDVGGDKGEVLRVARETLARRQVRSQDFARNYPGMARVLASVPWAPIARDDLNNLASTETHLGLLHAAWNRGRAETDLGYLGSQLAAARAVRGGEGLSETQQRELRDLDPDLLFRYERMRERLQALPEPTGLVSSAFAGVAAMLAQQARVLPAVAAAGLAGTAVAGPVGGFTGGLGTAFAQSAAIEGGSFYMDMREKGYTHDEAIGPSIVVAAANGALEVVGELAVGLPVAKAAARTLAIRRELAQAVAGKVGDAVLGGAPKAAGKLLQSTVGGAAKEAGKEYLLSVGGESLVEAAQDIVSAVWEEVVRNASTDDMRAKIRAQTFGDIAKRAVDTGLQMVKTMALFGALAPGYSFFRQAARIRAAEGFGKALADAAKVATESKVREQDPRAYGDAVDKVSKVPTLYVDPKRLTEVLSSLEAARPGITQQFNNTLPDVAAQIDPATRDGSLVEIPTGDYLAHIVNTPVQAELDLHLVPDPDAMSLYDVAEKRRQAEEFAKSVEGEDAKTALKAKTAEEKAAAKKWADGVRVARTKIEEQLKAAQQGELGADLKFTARDIPHMGRVLSAMYSALARALGVTPEEALQKRPVSITAQGVSVGAGEQLSAAERAVTETPEFKAWFGDSKVVDAEGKPLVVYHGTSSDFAEFSAERSGSNTGNPNARLGFFFSNSPSEASRYASDFGKGSGGRVSPVFLALRNPYKMPYREFDDLAMAEYRGLRDMVVKGAPTEEQAARIAAAKREANSAASARRDELIATGYDGVVVNIGGGQEFIAFHPEQIKSVNNRGTFDANSPNILEHLQSTRVPTGKKPTGDPHTGDQLAARQLGAYDLKLAQIILRPGATPFTVLHEMMHFYVDSLLSIASPNADAQAQIDRLLAFWKITREQWDAMSFAERAPLHEAVTYNWERYLATGEAPSAGLKAVFQKIILWFRRAYQSLQEVAATFKAEFGKDLPEITPELRRFFDLILATDDQVSMAAAAREQGSVFLTREQALSLGVTEPQWQEYQQLRDAQHAAAVGAVTVDALKHARWLRAAVLKSEAAVQAVVDQARAKIRAEVEKDVRGRPVYRAAEQLRNGSVATDEGTVPLRVDPETLSNIRWVDGADKAFAGMTKTGGVPADIAAMHLGWQSGDEMFRAIFNAEPIEQVIDRETEERFQSEEVFADPERMRAAVAAAVQGELRGRVLAAEMKMLTGSEKPARLTQAAAKDAAGRLLGRTLVKDVDTRRVLALEARAAARARQAIEDGKTGDAIVALRQQMVFHELAKLVSDSQQEIRTAVTAMREMWKAPDLETAKKRSMPLVQAARAVMAAWGIGDPARPAQFLELLRQHDPVTAQSIDGEIASWLARAPRSRNARTPGYSEAPLADFWAMVDQVKLLWHRAKRDMTIRTEHGEVAVETAGQEIVQQMLPIYGDAKAVTPMQKKERKGWLYRFSGAALKRTEHWVRMVDGGADGPLHRFLWRPLRKAYDNYLAAHETPYKTLYRLLKALEPSMTGAAVAAPEIGHTFSSDYEMLGALQHMGNVGAGSNLARMLDSYGWGQRDAETGELDTSKWWMFVQEGMKDGRIKKAHLDYLQAVWDFNSQVLAPQSQKAMLDLFGVFWKPVEAAPIETPWGTYAGGYTPIKLDPMLNHGLRIDVTLDTLREMESTMRQSMPGSKPAGHAIERVAQSNRPILLDIRGQLQHIDEVLRFVHLQPAIRDAASLLKNKTFQTYANAVDQTIIRGMLMPMLEATARNQITTPPESPAVALRDRVLNAIRINTGVRIMFGAVRIALQQLSGVSNANQYVRARHLLPATFYSLTNVIGSTREAMKLSQHMRLRVGQGIGNLHQDIEVLMDPERFGKLTQFAGRYGYILQALVQARTDVAVWHGAFAQSLEGQGADRTDEAAVKVAVDHADEAVRLSQGAQTPIDVAGYERAAPIWRLLQQFSSYPNLVLNQVAGARGAGPKTMAVIRAMIVPTFIAAAVTALLAPPKDFADDNGDGDTLDEYLKFFFGEQVKGATSLVPVVGPMIGSLMTRTDRRAVDRVTPAPAWSLVAASIPRLYGFVEDTVTTGQAPPVDGAFIRALTDVVGLTTGGVFAPLGRIAAYATDVQSGKVQPPSTASLVRGLITGR